MQTQLPCRLCADVADAVAGADTVAAACDGIVAALSRTLRSESVILQVSRATFSRIAGRGIAARERAWAAYLTALPPDVSIGLIPDANRGPATFLAASLAEHQRLFIVLDGDQSASAELPICAAIIRAGLRGLALREQAHHQRQLVRRAYRFLLAAGRARGLDEVAKTVTGQLGDIFNADRLSLARYDGNDDRLRIVAARGASADPTSTIAVRPGDWVIGHVHQSGKALIANDAADLPAPDHQRGRYGQAFAAVPLTHNGAGIGVLSITDKQDRSPFSRDEQSLLRALGPVLGAIMSAADREEEVERLRYAATIDSLTGLHNRAYLDRRLVGEVGRSQREHSDLSVLLVDIDDFKTINDSRGHAAGDEVLRRVSEVIRSAVRVFDVCARYGGDEFVIVMPNSDAAIAQACAERIRSRTAQSLNDAELPPITLSVGVATALANSTPTEMLERADRALYAAKASGKNAVRVDTPDATGTGEGVAARGPVPGIVDGPLLLPYMLVVDPEPARAALYRGEADKARIGLLVARDGPHAIRVMEQFGPPTVVIVDLITAAIRGLSVVEWFDGKETGSRIVAISESAALRRFVRASGNPSDILVVRPKHVAGAIGPAVRSAAGPNAVRDAALPATEPADMGAVLEVVGPQIRELVAATGVAAYLKPSGERRWRSGLSWNSTAPLTRVQTYLPLVADRVIDSGETVVIGQVGSPRFPAIGDETAGHSVIAVPLKVGGSIVGALCAFDDGPITLGENALAELERLGESVLENTPLPIKAPQAALVEEKRADDPSRQRGVAPPGWKPELFERARGEFEVARELARARREHRQLSVVLFDVSAQPDDAGTMKNDPLSAAAATLVRVVRPSDLPIRWSGHELLLVLPGLTGSDARTVAERVRAAMQAGGGQQVAVSGGVAEAELNEQFGNVVDRARQRVVQALSAGHNRVG